MNCKPLTATEIQAIITEKATVTFPINSVACDVAKELGFEDLSVEVGLYDRNAYRAPAFAWDALHAILTAKRAEATGTEKASITRSLQRVRTTAATIANESARRERIAARRAAREASKQRIRARRAARKA